MLIDDILEKVGLKYEDLTSSERETLHSWLNILSRNQLTIERVRDYISSMRSNVEQKLCETGHDSKQDLYLKARLKNYILLEAFLSTPEKARAAIDQTLAAVGAKK